MNRGARIAAEAGLGALAALLFACAAHCDLPWFERHAFLPYGFVQLRPTWVATLVRLGLGVAGALVVLVIRPRVARAVSRHPWRSLGLGSLRLALAVALALVATEWTLRARWQRRVRHRDTDSILQLRLGHSDPRLGWAFDRSRTADVPIGGRTVRFAVDAEGNRAPTQDARTDPAKATLIVAGESIAAGQGLDYGETFAALASEELSLQPLNVAVHGYGSDQSYLRLVDELARLQKPAVVVMLFVPAQVMRNLQDSRPHLVLKAGRLVLEQPASGFFARLELRGLWRSEVPVLGERALEQGLALTKAILRETAALVRARGATPLFLLPSEGPDRPFAAHREAALWRELFVEQGLPFAVADLDPSWVIPGDFHPDARAARKMAAEIVRALRR